MKTPQMLLKQLIKQGRDLLPDIGMGGEAGIVLAAGETHLLGRGNQGAVLDEGGRAVMVVAGDAEDSHSATRGCR